MKFLKFYNLLFEDNNYFKIYKILGGGSRDYRSGLYFPEENIFIECNFGRHKDLFDIIITERYPKNFYPPATELIKKHYKKFLENLQVKNISLSQYIKDNSYYQLFKDMGAIRYNIDRGSVSVSSDVELIDDVLKVFSNIEEQIHIEDLFVDLSKDERNGDMFFRLYVDADNPVPATRNELYKLLRQSR